MAINPNLTRRRLGAPSNAEIAVKDALRPMIESLRDEMRILEARFDILEGMIGEIMDEVKRRRGGRPRRDHTARIDEVIEEAAERAEVD